MKEILSNKLTNDDLTVVETSSCAGLSASYVLGTPQALSFYFKWQEGPTNIIQCYEGDDEARDNFYASGYMVELNSTFNPSTGCLYQLVDYFSNTTFFERDGLYKEDLIRYSLLSGAVECFSQTFSISTSGLQGHQFVVACAAFCLQELGHTFHIVAHTNESFLIKFCRERKWGYEVVGIDLD